MRSLPRLFNITICVVSVVTVILHVRPRSLRFFDPDHRHCGKSKEAHQWAIHAVYGARTSEHGYYDRLAVSTLEELPRDKKKIHKALLTLAYVAQKTNRVIRIHQSILPGYNSEFLQPYSLINAPALHKYGVAVVERGYWHRAAQAQGIKGEINSVKVQLENDPIGALTMLENDESIHELVFSVDDLLEIPDDDLSTLVGNDLGFNKREKKWNLSLSCGHDDIVDENPIPARNDALSP